MQISQQKQLDAKLRAHHLLRCVAIRRIQSGRRCRRWSTIDGSVLAMRFISVCRSVT